MRLIYDDLGSINTFRRGRRPLCGRKASRFSFNPLKPFALWSTNNRDHRKILVVDGPYGLFGRLQLGR